jgi:hypothetical protein
VLIVQTVGGWARISIDGMFRREGTSHREGVAPGRHQVRLERDGYAALDTSVAVAVRDTVIVRLTLRRMDS